MKGNINIFSDFLGAGLNSSMKSTKFFKTLKLADITPLTRKVRKILKVTIGL